MMRGIVSLIVFGFGRIFIKLIIISIGISVSTYSIAGNIKFKIEDIGKYTLDADSRPLNNKGQILVDLHYILENGTLTDTGMFRVSAINNEGQVVGSGGVPPYVGYIWTNGTLENLGYHWPHDINDLGQAVGSYGWGNFHAFIYDYGVITDMGTIGTGDHSIAFAVNNFGQAVGWASYDESLYIDHAFIWDENSGMVDLGTFGGISSFAMDINDNGQVVGGIYSNYGHRGFLWEDGTMTDLGSFLGAGALNFIINNNGYIVRQDNPWIWINEEWIDLNKTIIGKNSKDWTLHFSLDINDLNQIVGIGTFKGEYGHVYLLTPQKIKY